MRRRTFLGAGLAGASFAGVTLARPALARAQSATTLKFIPYADLALLDPAVSAFITRNHVMMVFDTLFAMDAQGRAQPSMLEGFTTEPDGLTWTLTLRPALKFHDGSPVLARDAVASIQRWQVNDSYGQALAAATAELSAPSDTVIKFRLKCRLGKSRQRYVSRHRIHRSERRWHGQRFFGLQGPNWVDVGLQSCSGRHKARAGFVWSLKKSNFWSAHCRPANSHRGKVARFRGKEIRRSAYKSAIYAKFDVALRTFAGTNPIQADRRPRGLSRQGVDQHGQAGTEDRYRFDG